MKTLQTTPKFALAGLGLALAVGQAQAQANLSIFSSPTVGFSVSANGQFATLGDGAPTGGGHVFVWSAATNSLTDIGGLAGPGGRIGISNDGSVINGSAVDGNGNLTSAVYNKGTGSWTALPSLGGSSGGTAASTWALSGDGRYVGGYSYVPGSAINHGFVTDTVTGTITDLGTTQARIQGITTGAQKLVGSTGSGMNGSMWTRNGDGSYTQTTLMNPDAPASALSLVNSMSANGLWAGGASFNGATDKPYRLNVDTGQVQFFSTANLVAGRSTTSPAAVSADGNTIVGITTPRFGTLANSVGFIWKADGTTTGNTLGGTAMSFDSYLAGFGLDLANHYDFVSIIGMSADASVFTGLARDNLTQEQVSFVVTVPVPEPSQYALLASGLGLVIWLARRRAAPKAC